MVKESSIEVGTETSEMTGNMILVVNGQDQITSCSEALSRHLGFTHLELVGQLLSDLIHQDMPGVPLKMMRMVTGSGNPWMGILMLQGDDGIVWLEANALAVMEHGQLAEINFVFTQPSCQVISRSEIIYRSYSSEKPIAHRENRVGLIGRMLFISILPFFLAGLLASFLLSSWIPIFLLVPAVIFSAALGWWASRHYRALMAKARKTKMMGNKLMLFTGRLDDVARLEVIIQMAKAELVSLLHLMMNSSSEVGHRAHHSIQKMSETIADISSQQRDLHLVAETTERVDRATKELADHSHDGLQAVTDAKSNVHAGEQLMRQAIDSITNLANIIQQAGDTVNQLQVRSDDINNIVEVIETIAEQTNLLALNAAIESARAGEHGRGFAVVADEVRQLASRTQTSTHEISTMIEALQQAANNMVTDMEQELSIVAKSTEQITQAGEAFSHISGTVDTIHHLSMKIAQLTDQQNQAVSEINQSIHQVDASAGSVRADAEATQKLNEDTSSVVKTQEFILDRMLKNAQALSD